MSSEENKAVVRRVFEDVFNNGKLDVLDEIFATSYGSARVITPERASENVDAKQLIARYRAAFPDAHFTIEDMVAEGDKVVVLWTIRGTHKEKFLITPLYGKAKYSSRGQCLSHCRR